MEKRREADGRFLFRTGAQQRPASFLFGAFDHPLTYFLIRCPV